MIKLRSNNKNLNMGKKSKAKQKRREVKTEEKTKKKIGFFQKFRKKDLKKEEKADKKPAKEKEKKHRKFPVTKKQILGGILTLIMLGILATVGYLLFQKAFKPSPVAALLPGNETIAFVEINSNFNHNQLEKTFKLLKTHEKYSKENLIKFIEDSFLVNYSNEIKPWLGRVVGFTYITSKNDGKVHLVYFAEIFSEINAKQFFKNGSSSVNYKEKDIYVAINGTSKVKIDDYLFMADNTEILKEIIDFQNSSDENLYDSENYRRIDDNMPLNKVAFIYINFNQISDEFLKEFSCLSERGLTKAVLSPFLNLISSEGMSLIALDDKLAIQSFINLNREEMDDLSYVSNRDKYQADLTAYVSSDLLAFWGGENMEYQIKRILESLSGNSGTLTLFDKIIETYTQKYFGPEINFKNDILPLFANEFALSLEQINNKNIYKLIIELADPQAGAVTLHEIADNFAEIGAFFEPQIVEHTLEDGTVSKEIVAVPEEIIKGEASYEGTTIYTLKMGEKDIEIAYAVIDNVGIISTGKEGIKSSIDAKNEKIINLKSSDEFDKLIIPVLEHSDEVSYFNMEKLSEFIFGESVPSFIELISSISSGKNYFNDGITSINYLRIK